MGAADKVLLGVVGAPRGIRGEVRIRSFTADPAAIGDYGPLMTADGRSFQIRVVASLKGPMVVARLSGVGDRNAAEALTGTELFIERSQLPPPDGEDDFYYADLLGLAVVQPDGTPVGTVVGVENFGAGDLLEIAPAGVGQTAFLPFAKAFVPEVDLAGGRLVATPPAGLFKEDEE